jgi:uncharacterized membrane protein YvbJ
MTIYCPFCGEKLVDEAKFCKNCGKNISEYSAQFQGSSNNYSYQPPVVENNHTAATVIGFICAILIPLLGFIFGIYLLTRKDSSKAKKYGTIMIIVSALVWLISFMTTLMWY